MIQPFTIRECLHGYANETLGAICDQWKLAASSKPSRLKAIERILADPLHIQSAVSALEPAAVRMLRLVIRKGTVSATDLLSVPGLCGARQPSLIAQKLAQAGLLLVCPHDRHGVFSLSLLSRERVNGHGDPDLFVPRTVAERLPKTPPLGTGFPAASNPPSAPDPPTTPRAIPAFLEVLRIVDLLAPRLTANGELHRNDETRVDELRREAGVSRESLNLAMMMARQLGCITVRQRRLVTSDLAGHWAVQSNANRTRDLFWAYVRSPMLTDLKLFFPDIFASLDEHLPTGSLRRTYHRDLVVGILRESPPDTWHPAKELAQCIYQLDRNILFLEEPWRTIQANAQDAGAAWQDRAWRSGEERLFHWIAQTLLPDLGIAELGQQGACFRLTPSGRYTLGIGPAPSEEPEVTADALVVQPDFEIIAYLDRCNPALQRKLDTFCERRRAGAVSTYALTQESVYRGTRAGITPEDAIQTLTDASSRDLPENVREQVMTWQRKIEAITLHRHCTVLECQEPAQLEKMLSQYPGARRIGSKFLLLSEQPAGLSAPLDYTTANKPILRQEDGLQFSVPWHALDLFSRKRLAEISDLHEDDDANLWLRLSRAKLARPEDWNLVIAQLESLTIDALQARYRAALRAWGGDLQPASTGSATLLRFDDPDVCEAVLEFPEVAESIEGRLGLNVLVVRKGRIAALRKALRAHGIPVQTSGPVVDTEPPEVWTRQWLDRRKTGPDTNGRDAAAPARANSRPAPDYEALPTYSPRIICELLADAIARRKPVMIEYRPAWSDQPSVRRVDPVSLDLVSSSPSLSGFCHTAQSARTFQLARIVGVRTLEDDSF